jgi:hypothetical protein
VALGIRARDVERISRQLATTHGKRDYYISHSSLVTIEGHDSTPSIYKLYTLSVIYSMNFVELLALYGVDVHAISKAQLALRVSATRLIKPEVYDPNRPVTLPMKFAADVNIEQTNLFSRMFQAWGSIPVALFEHLDLEKQLYGYIGLSDYTLDPLIRPGSIVRINDRDRKIQSAPWENEFARPIYFFELRQGYACGWCQLDGRELSIIPHSLSRAPIRRFRHPDEVDIVGRVTAFATWLVRASP